MSLALRSSYNRFLKHFPAFPVERGDAKAVAPRDNDEVARQPTADGASADAANAAHSNRRDLADLRQNFDALVKRYEQPIYNLALQLVGDEDEAGDVMVETFVSAHRARDSFRGDSKVFTWLYRIAINHGKNRRKSKARSRLHEGPSLDAGFGPVEEDGNLLESAIVADWSQSPEVILQRSELRTKIHDAIDGLPYEYRSVLLLREMEEMNYNDIAEATGLSLEAVKTRISRARGMVRRRVAPYYSPDQS